MKVSRYNIFFPYLDNVVGYNSLKNDFIFLTNELYELYTQTLANDITALKTLHPEFWDLLVDKLFIIPNETDELQQVKNLVHSIDCCPEHYHLIINPTLNCNFSCWYCYETHIKGSKMNDETIDRVKKHIIEVLKNKTIKNFTVSWFGGEPLLYYKQVVTPILEFITEYIADKDIQFSTNFTSNGMLINKKLLEDAGRFKINYFQITLDGHKEQHNKVRCSGNKKGSYDEIVSNIKKCLKSNIHVNCRLNISKDTFQGIEKIIDDFAELSSEDRKFLTFSFHQVWQEETNLHNQILELIELFKSNNYSTQYNMYTDTVRDSCYADKKQQAIINYNGDAFKCSARDFTAENRKGVLKEDGTIEWNEKYYAQMNAKFKNSPCIRCKILPICNGGCSQKAIESKDVEYCIRDFDENKKIEVVLAKLELALS